MMTQKAYFPLRLDGPLTVSRAEELQVLVLTALEAAEPVLIQLPEDERIDISFLQLLIAAQKTAAREGKILALADDAAAPLKAEIARCGIPEVDPSSGVRILPAFTTGSSQ